MDPEEGAVEVTGTPHGSRATFELDGIVDMEDFAATTPFGLKLMSRRSLRADLSFSRYLSLPNEVQWGDGGCDSKTQNWTQKNVHHTKVRYTKSPLSSVGGEVNSIFQN